MNVDLSYLGESDLFYLTVTLVFAGYQNKQEVAVKFLVENKQISKLQRFKAEYFNIKLMGDQDDIVNYINYEELQISEDCIIPSIVMKKYEKSLYKLKNENSEISEEIFKKLFYFLINSLKKVHQKGIIHRDIKPENILLTKENDFVLTDFGIASFNSDLYALKARTVKNERLANYEFSAPEQAQKGVIPSPSMDIYAIGQVCQWYVFGITHKGTNRKKVTDIFNTEEVMIIDMILEKCLYNEHKERYQSVQEIIDDIDKIKKSRRKVDPFDEMILLSDAISATYPHVSQDIQFITEEKYVKRLVENINNRHFKQKLWFNTGIGNNSFNKLTYLGNKKILIDYRELKIKGIWLYIGRYYDDLIIFETEKNEPFYINGEETYYALVINDKYIVGAHHLESGYVEIEDEVYALNDLKVEEYNRNNGYRYYFIGTHVNARIKLTDVA